MMDYRPMSMERVTRLVNQLGHPFVYQGPDMDEAVVVLPLAQFEALVTGEAIPSRAQASLPFEKVEAAPSLFSYTASKPVLDKNEEKNAYISENRRLLETIAQFSSVEEVGIEPTLEVLPSMEELTLSQQQEVVITEGLMLEERFYLQPVENG